MQSIDHLIALEKSVYLSLCAALQNGCEQMVVGCDALWKTVETHFEQIPGGNTAASAGVQSWYHTAITQHEYMLWGMKVAQCLDTPVSLGQSV